jgi:uncharacterized membrane protein
VKIQTSHVPLVAPEGPHDGQAGGASAVAANAESTTQATTMAASFGSRAGGTFDMEILVGYILLAGVLVSVTLILAGLVWHWLRTGQIGIQYSIADMNFFQFLHAQFGLLLNEQFRPRLLVSLGIGTLMLTPFIRVLASVFYFAVAARNWKYTVFTAFVLTVLTYSLFLR